MDERPLLIDLRYRIHMDSLREALLFCCIHKGDSDQKVEASIDAIRKCASWFPLEERR